MTNLAIQIKGLTKIYPPDNRAVDTLDLEIKEGEIMALLGPNGAGKSTTIRAASTLCGFEEGNVVVSGFDVDTNSLEVRQAIGVVAQQTGIDYFLTGRENMVLQGHLYRMKKADINDRIAELAAYFELDNSIDNLVSTYSGGMRRKLDIACALIHRPKILFLDEPTLGLDIKNRKILWRHIDKLNKEFGLTILLTTHYLEEADSLSHQVAIINNGKVQVVDTPDALKNSIHGDSITVSFDDVGKNEQGFFHFAQQQPYVKGSTWEDNKLHLYVKDGGANVAALMAIAAENKALITNLSLSRPTLDDVFLKYTGSSILETKEEEGDEWWKQWAGKGGNTGKWKSQWGADDNDSEEGDEDQSWKNSDWLKENDDGKNLGAKKREEAQWQHGAWSEDQQKQWSDKKDDSNAAGEQGSQQWDQSQQGDWQNNEWNKNKDGGEK